MHAEHRSRADPGQSIRETFGVDGYGRARLAVRRFSRPYFPVASVPPPVPARSVPSREDRGDAYARELLETLDALTPAEKQLLDSLAALDRLEGEPAESE
jgi:hypothetical protein